MSTEKCAHPMCTCVPAKGQKFCSTYCEEAKDVTTLECECNHPGCAAEKL